MNNSAMRDFVEGLIADDLLNNAEKLELFFTSLDEEQIVQELNSQAFRVKVGLDSEFNLMHGIVTAAMMIIKPEIFNPRRPPKQPEIKH